MSKCGETENNIVSSVLFTTTVIIFSSCLLRNILGDIIDEEIYFWGPSLDTLCITR